jgi:hypothetical protein
MLYLLGVYGLVIIVVFLPIAFFYSVVGVSWLAVAAIRFLLQYFCPIRTEFLSKPNQSAPTNALHTRTV